MRYLSLYENFNINHICDRYGIENYTINQDGTVDVDSYVNLQGLDIKRLPLIFNKVSGFFDCGYNKLTSLVGSPKEVNGEFSCNSNKLESLNGSPRKVKSSFLCSYNKLKTLKGGPEIVGGSYGCNDNKLIDVCGFPENFHNIIEMSGNPVSEITYLVFVHQESKFIKWLNEYNVIQGNKIFELGLDQAYYMATKEELSLESKKFRNYILI